MGWHVNLPTGSELSPSLRDGHTKGGEKREDGAKEDGATTAEPAVKGVGDPSSANELLGAIFFQ